jgi:hypothetical protein
VGIDSIFIRQQHHDIIGFSPIVEKSCDALGSGKPLKAVEQIATSCRPAINCQSAAIAAAG